jgi:3-phenylpropionate/trans-cinnamate dioxygenase ferredoxin reductase component
LAPVHTIAVVGGGLAGLRAVEALRAGGHEGPVVWIGAERHLPYDRPPLSKQVLRGEWEPERIALRRDGVEALATDLRLGTRALSLDAGARSLALEGGETVRFDGLVIATGAAPRRLPGAPELDGVFVLRSLDDALAIRRALDGGPRVAVVGGGFIGSEVAASCRERGLDVTLIEALSQPLEQALGAELGAVCAALHRDHGVALRLGAGVAALEGGSRVERIRLADGSCVAADVVVVGIGVRPETGWLEGSGLRLDDGILCDEACQAAPGIVAAGDVARWPNRRYGMRMRVEHWTNAVEQAGAAAARLLAGSAPAEPYAPVPYVWSDQYDRKFLLAGALRPGDEIQVVDGSLAERRFVALAGRGGRLVGAIAMNRARLFVQWRRALHEDLSFEAALARARAA